MFAVRCFMMGEGYRGTRFKVQGERQKAKGEETGAGRGVSARSQAPAWERRLGSSSFPTHRKLELSELGSQAGALVFIHKSIEECHFDMDAGMADSDVGRNKAIQARSARWRFRRVREVFAGNASSRCHSNRLIPAYVEMCITMRAGAWEPA